MKTIAIFFLLIGSFGSCSKDDDKNSVDSATGGHSYEISIKGGKTYTGEIPKSVSGVFNPVAFVEYNEEAKAEVFTALVYDVGNFQIAIGIALDNNKKPNLTVSSAPISFKEWGTETAYKPAEKISLSFENYKEHEISFAGEQGTTASVTIKFEGMFKKPDTEELVSVTGKIVFKAP